MARQLFIQKQVETSDFKSHTKSIHLEVGGLGERFMLRHIFVIFIKRVILLMWEIVRDILLNMFFLCLNLCKKNSFLEYFKRIIHNFELQFAISTVKLNLNFRKDCWIRNQFFRNQYRFFFEINIEFFRNLELKYHKNIIIFQITDFMANQRDRIAILVEKIIYIRVRVCQTNLPGPKQCLMGP